MANLALSGTSNLALNESEAATFTVALDSAPAGPVVVTIAESAADLQRSRFFLEFDEATWSVPQSIHLTAGNVTEGRTVLVTVTLRGAGEDDVATFPVTLYTREEQTLTVTPEEPSVAEGASVAISIVLGARPYGDVTIDASLLDDSLGSLDVASVTFTQANWATPQDITFTAADTSSSYVDATANLYLDGHGGGYCLERRIIPIAIPNDDDNPADATLNINKLALSMAPDSSAVFRVRLTEKPTETIVVTATVTEGFRIVPPSRMWRTDNWMPPHFFTVYSDPNSDGTTGTVTLSGTGGLSGEIALLSGMGSILRVDTRYGLYATAPAAPTSDSDLTPDGWMEARPAATPGMDVYQIRRTVTLSAGDFGGMYESATDWVVSLAGAPVGRSDVTQVAYQLSATEPVEPPSTDTALPEGWVLEEPDPTETETVYKIERIAVLDSGVYVSSTRWAVTIAAGSTGSGDTGGDGGGTGPVVTGSAGYRAYTPLTTPSDVTADVAIPTTGTNPAIYTLLNAHEFPGAINKDLDFFTEWEGSLILEMASACRATVLMHTTHAFGENFAKAFVHTRPYSVDAGGGVRTSVSLGVFDSVSQVPVGTFRGTTITEADLALPSKITYQVEIQSFVRKGTARNTNTLKYLSFNNIDVISFQIGAGNTGGEKGEKGDKGDKGDTGDRGPAGPAGTGGGNGGSARTSPVKVSTDTALVANSFVEVPIAPWPDDEDIMVIGSDGSTPGRYKPYIRWGDIPANDSTSTNFGTADAAQVPAYAADTLSKFDMYSLRVRRRTNETHLGVAFNFSEAAGRFTVHRTRL